MLYITQRLTGVEKILDMIYYKAVDVGVKKSEDGKYFMFSNNPIFETNTYLVGFYILKDI